MQGQLGVMANSSFGNLRTSIRQAIYAQNYTDRDKQEHQRQARHSSKSGLLRFASASNDETDYRNDVICVDHELALVFGGLTAIVFGIVYSLLFSGGEVNVGQ